MQSKVEGFQGLIKAAVTALHSCNDDGDDDDDDDDDDDKLFLLYGWPTKGKALFPAGTIVRVPHHRESPTCREQDLNLDRTWI